jgi:tetratricopeptide (TPR) repeat protein
MVGTHIVSRTLAICALVLGVAAVASPALAQTGQIRGKVVDADNKPVEGAKVTLQAVDTNSKFELKTKKNGEYMQIGVPPGNYKITAEKDGLSATKNSHISLDMAEVNLTLAKGGAASADMSKEDRAKAEARVAGIKAAYSEAATLANAGKFDEAIAKFNEVLKDVPKCPECYIGIGASSAAKKDYPAAEAAYKKALELDPNLVEAYSGLATIYNDQKKFTEAQAMSAEAMKRATTGGAAGGGADSLYNSGVISWNANDFAKAQEQFAAAVKANPQHAESHFMLGRVYLNLGKLPDAAKEFEAYTKIAPNGPNAKEAASNLEMLKTYIK